MRRVMLGTTGIETSCLGFGCASLGSRVPVRDGLRALEEAFEAGVTWIDLAPIYGGGAAEQAIAPFLARHRGAVQLCTKVGLALPAPAGGLKGALMPVARRAVSAVPALRAALRRRGVGAARPLPLTAELVRRSLEASLRRLGTDHVDLYALHDPCPEDVAREPVLRALEDILAAGKARAVAVAGNADAAAALVGRKAAGQGLPYRILQLPLPEPGAPTDLLPRAAAAGLGLVTHSVFGIGGALDRLARRLAEDEGARAEVTARTGLADPEAALALLLLRRAFALNRDGVVLASMFSPRSRAQNLAVAGQGPGEDGNGLIDRLAA